MNRPYTRAQGLADLLRQRILVLDGAMGTMIQRFKLSEAQYRGERFADFHKDVQGNNELLSLTRADIIRDIHEGYLAAGADLIETNTFGAQRIAQADYHMELLAYEMNVAAARLARAACVKYSTPEKPLLNAGLCARRQGRIDEAEMNLRRALAIRADLPSALLTLAEIAFETRRFVEADELFIRYSRLVEPPLSALALGVRIARAAGDQAMAESLVAQLRRRFPNASETRELAGSNRP